MLGVQGTRGNGPTALNWKIGYSYDVTTSALKKVSSGSHEIVLGICKKIDPVKPPESWEDVRFF
jgi:hypothetical protein